MKVKVSSGRQKEDTRLSLESDLSYYITMDYEVMTHGELQAELNRIRSVCSQSLSEVNELNQTYSGEDGEIISFLGNLSEGRDLIQRTIHLLEEYSESIDRQEITVGFLNKAVSISDATHQKALQLGGTIPKEKVATLEAVLREGTFSKYQIIRDTLHILSEMGAICYVLRNNFIPQTVETEVDEAAFFYSVGNFRVHNDNAVYYQESEVSLSDQMKRLLILLLDRAKNGNGFADTEIVERELREDMNKEIEIGKVSTYVSKLRNKLEENNIPRAEVEISCAGTGLEARWRIEFSS